MDAHEEPIRVGVVGVGRGRSFMRQAAQTGFTVTAICDTREEELRRVGDELGVTTHTDYDALLNDHVDAVILANYFHEHAPLAIQALRAGKHVMSECTAAKTLAEALSALCRAVEESGKILHACRELSVYGVQPGDAPTLRCRRNWPGPVYAEGEYNHPMAVDDALRISSGLRHWRNNLLGNLLLYTRVSPADGDHGYNAGRGQCAGHSKARRDPVEERGAARYGCGHPLPYGQRCRLSSLWHQRAWAQHLVPAARHTWSDGIRSRAWLLGNGIRARAARRVGSAHRRRFGTCLQAPISRVGAPGERGTITAGEISSPTIISARQFGVARNRI